jgi:hypothetical protein
MSRRTALPAEAQVRKALAELVGRCDENGTRPSVLALAAQFELSNTTFRRNFPDIAAEIGAARTLPPAKDHPQAISRYDRLIARNAKLRRANRDLRDHLTLAAAHIQRLTLENDRLLRTVETATGVTRLPRSARSGAGGHVN